MKIRIFDISDFSNDSMTEALALLPQERRSELSPRLHTAGARLSLAGEMLARQMLAEELSAPPESFVINKTPLGKPYAEGADIHFNISHSGNFAACALHFAPLGLDIQAVTEPRERVLRRSFSESEREYILSSPSDSAVRFTRLWCMKEAFVKRAGGSVLSRDVFSCRLKGGEPILNYDDFSFAFYPAPEGYILAVCFNNR